MSRFCDGLDSVLNGVSFHNNGLGYVSHFSLNKNFQVNFCNPNLHGQKTYKKAFPFYDVNTRGNTLAKRQVHTKTFANVNNHRYCDCSDYPKIGLFPKL